MYGGDEHLCLSEKHGSRKVEEKQNEIFLEYIFLSSFRVQMNVSLACGQFDQRIRQDNQSIEGHELHFFEKGEQGPRPSFYTVNDLRSIFTRLKALFLFFKEVEFKPFNAQIVLPYTSVKLAAGQRHVYLNTKRR